MREMGVSILVLDSCPILHHRRRFVVFNLRQPAVPADHLHVAGRGAPLAAQVFQLVGSYVQARRQMAKLAGAKVSQYLSKLFIVREEEAMRLASSRLHLAPIASLTNVDGNCGTKY